MKDIFLFACALTALTACSSELTFVPYRSADGLYSLRHPEGWLNEVPRTNQVLRDRESGVELIVDVSWAAHDKATFENTYTTDPDHDTIWRRTGWREVNGAEQLRVSGEDLHASINYEILVVRASDRVLTFTASTIESSDGTDAMNQILESVRVHLEQPRPETDSPSD